MQSGDPVKYGPLRRSLQHERSRREITMGFGDVERLIGHGLPASAHRHRAWWGNNQSSVQAAAWMSAGWLIDMVDQRARLVPFRRN